MMGLEPNEASSFHFVFHGVLIQLAAARSWTVKAVRIVVGQKQLDDQTAEGNDALAFGPHLHAVPARCGAGDLQVPNPSTSTHTCGRNPPGSAARDGRGWEHRCPRTGMLPEWLFLRSLRLGVRRWSLSASANLLRIRIAGGEDLREEAHHRENGIGSRLPKPHRQPMVMALPSSTRRSRSPLCAVPCLNFCTKCKSWGLPSLHAQHLPQDSFTKNSVRFSKTSSRQQFFIHEHEVPRAESGPRCRAALRIHGVSSSDAGMMFPEAPPV